MSKIYEIDLGMIENSETLSIEGEICDDFRPVIADCRLDRCALDPWQLESALDLLPTRYEDILMDGSERISTFRDDSAGAPYFTLTACEDSYSLMADYVVEDDNTDSHHSGSSLSLLYGFDGYYQRSLLLSLTAQSSDADVAEIGQCLLDMMVQVIEEKLFGTR